MNEEQNAQVSLVRLMDEPEQEYDELDFLQECLIWLMDEPEQEYEAAVSEVRNIADIPVDDIYRGMTAEDWIFLAHLVRSHPELTGFVQRCPTSLRESIRDDICNIIIWYWMSGERTTADLFREDYHLDAFRNRILDRLQIERERKKAGKK